MAANDAFTAGVRPGGLTNSTEIRLLLCYLVKNAGPITRTEIENALMEEALVNYFEIGSCLDDIARQQLVTADGDRYTITDKGRKVAQELAYDLPRSVREKAVAAVLRSHPRFALTLLGCMFFFLTHTISNTYMNALVGKAGGTASAVGTSLAISAVLELPAMTMVSRLQKRFSPGFFLRFAAGAEVVKFLIFYLAHSMPFIYLGQCMQFFQFAAYAPATVYYVAAALPERDQLKGQSLIYVAGSGLGGALGNLLGGRLLDRSGIQAALLLGTVSAAASLLTFCLSTREDSR